MCEEIHGHSIKNELALQQWSTGGIFELTEYDRLLKEVLARLEKFRLTTAKEYVPKMYLALRNEDPSLTAQDARDRIEKDCLGKIWTKRTILEVLPDEAKDPKKQKYGRSRQKKAFSAAVSAAELSKKQGKKILIDAKGNPVEDDMEPTSARTSPPTTSNDLYSNQSQLKEGDLLHFQFSLPADDVWKYMVDHYLQSGENENDFWINVVFNKRTEKVISASIRKP